MCGSLRVLSPLAQAYDATALAAAYCGPQLDVLIDQGRDDQFLSASQLLPDNLIAVCSEKKVPVVFRLQPVSSNTRLLTDQHDSCMLGKAPPGDMWSSGFVFIRVIALFFLYGLV